MQSISSQSESVADAGCVAALEDVAAGCTDDLSEKVQASALPLVLEHRAGCAVLKGPAASDTKAKPPQTVREFERALRGLGFTRLQASHIARQGFAGAAAPAVKIIEN